jgi:Fe-S oxidoreductase
MMSDDREKTSSLPAAPPPSYAEHFGTIRTLGDLTRDPESRPWLTSVPKDAPHRKYVVWLGCNILRTAHLAETLDDILNYLKTDFATLGGPSNCCGIVHQVRGDTAVAQNMLRQTMKKFDAFTPEQMLNWCPSCDSTLRTTSPDELTDTAKRRISVTRFLASQIEGMRFATSGPMKIAIHCHGGFAESISDGKDAQKLLSRIPDLTVIDMPAVEGLSRHCADPAIKNFGEARYPLAMNEWALEARRRGATHIVSIYHSCHRHLLLAQRRWPEQDRMPIINYLTLLARAFGLPPRADKFARLSAKQDIETMIAEVEPNLQALEIKPDQARRAFEAQFKR